MATVTEVGELVTTRLRERLDRLVAAVEDDDTEFAEVVRIADELGELAQTIGGIYGEVEQILLPTLRGVGGPEGADGGPAEPEHEAREDRGGPQEGEGSGVDSGTKDELLERAREVNIQGRSAMSKEELAQAVEAEERLTKEELLERARQADLPGRTSMTKDELRSALHDAGA